MAHYFEPHNARASRAQARSSAHSDHTGLVLTALALLMLGLLALVWTGKETLSPLPQSVPISQPAQAVAAPAPAPAPILAPRAAPIVAPPASDAIAAAGDTRAVQP